MFEHQYWSCKKENNNKELERSALTSRDRQTNLSTRTQLVDSHMILKSQKGKGEGQKYPLTDMNNIYIRRRQCYESSTSTG